MIKIFVDTDVVISSLISKTGAAFLLLNQIRDIELIISNISFKEIEKVVKRLELNIGQAEEVTNNFSTVELEVKQELDYQQYVTDSEDSHIVAAANRSSVRFLVSYNIRHFKVEKIKEDLNIIITTPANLLQYLRSL